MTSLRNRTNLIFIFIIFSSLIFGLLTVRSYQSISQYHDTINESFTIRQKIRLITSGHFNKKIWKELRIYRDQMPDGERKKALTQVISAYSSRNPRLVSRRSFQFENVEQKAFVEIKNAIAEEKQTLLKNGFLTFAFPLLGIILLIVYLRKSVFYPLKRLSRRMIDFLSDRYSFKFAIPDNNEIGDLQRTFNSLAQRVLNNMDELKNLDRAKSEFLNIASHELRTPMTSIKGSLGLLKSGVIGNLDESSKRLIRIAESEADRLIRLINDLLDLAKIESRSLSLNKKWISIDLLLEKSLEGLLGLAQSAGVRLKLQTFKIPVEVNADADHLQQIVTNLVSNAIKFSPKDSEVLVHVHLSKSRQLVVEVSDHGPGIAKKDQELIFEKFRQTNGIQKSQLVKGTGLGLAIAKALVAEHGGDIGVHSTPGHGSTFFFTLKEWRKADRESLEFNQESTESHPIDHHGAAA